MQPTSLEVVDEPVDLDSVDAPEGPVLLDDRGGGDGFDGRADVFLDEVLDGDFGGTGRGLEGVAEGDEGGEESVEGG
jgi:hypothetical protein